jgi:hypothetical protein
MFISKAFGGRASDKFIVEKSGFMNYLLPGDEIQIIKDFNLSDSTGIHELNIMQARLLDIPNLRPKSSKIRFNFNFKSTSII